MVAATRLTATLLLAVLVTAAACSKMRPVLNVEGHPLPPGAESLSLDQIGRTIADGAAQAHWHIEQVVPGRMTGSFDDGKHGATVDITYDQTAYSIALVNSTNLHQEGDEIHKRYDQWIRRLENDIDRSLERAAARARS
jgi:hypothetical protein